MAQEMLSSPEDQIFALSEKTTVSFINKCMVAFTIHPQGDDAEGQDPTVITYNTNLWRKLRCQMSTINTQLKNRNEVKIKLILTKYAKVAFSPKQDTWTVSIMTYTRMGAPIYQACVFLTEDEWDVLVQAEPKFTQIIEDCEKKERAQKRKLSQATAENKKMALVHTWKWNQDISDQYFFSHDQALENFYAKHPGIGDKEVEVMKKYVPPPSLPHFLLHAYCYAKNALAHHKFTQGKSASQDFDTVLEETQVPKDWLKTAYTQIHIFMGLPVTSSRVEPYIECLLYFVSERDLKEKSKSLDWQLKENLNLLCAEIISPYLRDEEEAAAEEEEEEEEDQ